MRYLRPTLKNGVVLHALVEQLLARGENTLARATTFVSLIVFATGRQLVKAQAAGSRSGVGMLVDGGLGTGVLGGALTGDCGGGGDGLAGAIGEGAGCLRRAGG